jgi:4-methyl-5(b-hydroxyethyl)-thiazole monophosphate biosynthesis
MAKKIIVVLAEGFEEVEAVTPIDYLRRAGIEVTVAALGTERTVTGSRGITLCADTTLAEILKAKGGEPWDGIVLPGGLPGSDNLAASKELEALTKDMAAAGKLISAICAAPARVLARWGLLAGKKWTCYPGQEVNARQFDAGDWKEDRVVVDGNLITSRAAGTAGEFACAIIEKLKGQAEAENLAEKVLISQ